MGIIKEFVRNKEYDYTMVIIRTNTYTSTLQHLNMLADIQRADFPTLTTDKQEAVKYGGKSYKGTMGIEGRVELDAIVPGDYSQRNEAEYII